MEQEISRQIEQTNQKRARRSIWRRVVSAMACVVVFCTVYALILPAITMEQKVFCGYEEHSHTESCYRQDTQRMLICSAEHLGLHVHEADCYDEAGALICEELDYVAHTHSGDCYGSEGDLICPLPEIQGHTHEDTCYAEEEPVLHTHTEACVEKVQGQLICELEESAGHRHEGDCFAVGENLVCTQPENHVHGDGCFEYPLICTESTEPHTHGDGCYAPGTELECTTEEGHVHGEACWETSLVCTDEAQDHTHEESCWETALICTVPENHTHEDSCYKPELVCPLDEETAHVHDEACYAAEGNLICQAEENHTHGESCFETVLVCQEAETEGHSHTEECYEWTQTLICGLEEGQPEQEPRDPVLICDLPTPEDHTHTDSCFEEVALTCTEDHAHTDECEGAHLVCEKEVHEHDLHCYADATADVETADIWEKTMSRVVLSGDSRSDLLAIARTQLGYEESTRNYVVNDDQTIRGYTRYGAWYGDHYGDWCAMFVSFCLNYSQIDEIPYNSNVASWIADLKQMDVYRQAGEYTPVPGDLIFYDMNQDGRPDHIGIVEELIGETESQKAQIKALEGNASDKVRYVYYNHDNSRIIGFAVLPEKLTAEELAQVEHVKTLIDLLPTSSEIEAKRNQYRESGETEQWDLWYSAVTVDAKHAYREYSALTREQKEYVHNADKLMELEPVWSAQEEELPLEYNCGQKEHTHSDDCYDEAGELCCELPEHVHTQDCLVIPEPAPERPCGKQEHTHGAACYDGEGNLICQTPEHTHSYLCDIDLSEIPEAHREEILAVIARIDEMPGADEIEARIEAFEEAEDYDGEEAWLMQVYDWVREVYLDYYILHADLRPLVANADKLMELEFIWSSKTLADGFWSSPTRVTGAHTSDFIDLNLYDYTSGINTNFRNLDRLSYTNKGGYTSTTSKWPGFQWNGGAYKYNNTFHRHQVDYIDFGNSLITDMTYGTSSASYSYGKSSNAVQVGLTKPTSQTYRDQNKVDGKYTGFLNELDYTDYGITNRPVGISLNGYGDAASRDHATLAPILTPGGYPALNANIGGGSLGYLFGGNLQDGTRPDYVVRKNSESIDGLFRINSTSGDYFFNSRENHAQYSNNQFTLYKEVITPNFIIYPFGNFLPFNTITEAGKATDVSQIGAGQLRYYLGEEIIANLSDSDASESQLKTMLGLYRNDLGGNSTASDTKWKTWSARDAVLDYFQGDGSTGDDTPSQSAESAITERINKGMYNIDFDEKTNFFFGMDMSMEFMMPKDGLAGNDNGSNSAAWAYKSDGTPYRTGSPDGIPDYPMTFNFTGDDDVWVYLDGILFLDLSGIHRHVGGRINYQSGTVEYFHLDVENTGDVANTPYQTFAFTDIVRAGLEYRHRADGSEPLSAEEITAKVNALINPETGTFYDYSTHQFDFFYMERGSGSSVCRMNFNFPLLKKNTLEVSKVNVPDDETVRAKGNPDYYFNVIKQDESGLFIRPGTGYRILDASGAEIGTGTVDRNGIFTIKAGQTAVFEDIPENAGSYYVQELIRDEDHLLYGDNVRVNGDALLSTGIVNWAERDWYSPESGDPNETGPGGDTWHFYSSQYADASSHSAFYFQMENGVITDRLGSLSVTKQLQRYTEAEADVDHYRIYIQLDGEPLEAGLELTTDQDRQITVGRDDTGSYVELMENETITIDHIISGTEFKIWEAEASAADFLVDYSATGADELKDGTNAISGIVRVEGDVRVCVTNSENGAQIRIPVEKTIRNFVPGTYAWSFLLEEADDQGNVKDDGLVLTAEVSMEEAQAAFEFGPITYIADQIPEDTGTFYYRIREQEAGSAAVPNSQQFLVEITVSKSGDAQIVPAITAVSERVEDAWVPVADETVLFTNTLAGVLTLEKELIGQNAGQTFGFLVELETGTSGLEVLPGTFTALVHHLDGTVTEETITPDPTDGALHLGLKAGQKVEIRGIPLGARWRITEGTVVCDAQGNFSNVQPISPLGYIVANRVNEGEREQGHISSGVMAAGNTAVVFTNSSTYELPKTGGTGTQLYTLTGMLLTAAAILLYIQKKRRKGAV